MSAQPMLEPSKDVETPVAAAIVIPTVVTTDDQLAKHMYDQKVTSLRRACTALLVFSMLCSRPWPSAGWLGFIGAVAVLCASSQKLLWRARVARFASAVVAIFAGITLITLASSINEMPQHVSDNFHTLCDTIPADTFHWGYHLLDEHKHKCKVFFERHASTMMFPKDSAAVVDKEATIVAMKTNSTALVDTAEHWSQEQTCNVAAHMVNHFVRMMMIGELFAHFLLLLSALLVVKRACRLRCAAYKCGLLSWNKCGRCKCTPQAAAPAAAKELA